VRVGDDDPPVILHRPGEVEGPELPPAIADLQVQLAAYGAALAVYSRMMPPSLMDFLK
jgi:hypothetical protein